MQEVTVPKTRFAIKIVGASGQGINTVGEILGLALKRTGLSVFAYREYPSLIKGGHATYQIDFAPYNISASTQKVDAVVVLNRQHTIWHLDELYDGGMIFHSIDNPRINQEEAKIIKEKNIRLIYVPALKLAESVGGNLLMINIVLLGYIWKLLNLPVDVMESVVRKQFADKPKFVEVDVECMKAGFGFKLGEMPKYTKRLIKPDEVSETEKSELHLKDETIVDKYFQITTDDNHKGKIFLTGNHAISLGAITAGVRAHYAYPMTPSSSILSQLANMMHQTGMIVKQAEDELTAAAMAIGSMHMGTRAMTATSGGGFDLMTEHVSLAAILEVPFVCVLAQRPGPATGLPTWTGQGDLFLAIFAAHGEFTRCVIGVGTPEEAYYGIQEAFNIAEEYQIPVILLTDKQLAESIYTTDPFDTERVPINRGQLVVDPAELSKLKSTDRYKFTDTGISPRWIPGSKAADFNANSDEHDEEGNVVEDAEPAAKMYEKRIHKEQTLLENLPQVEIMYNKVDLNTAEKKVSFIGWGSTKGIMQDVMKHYESLGIKIDYLHVKYLWPLKTEEIIKYLDANPETILIEHNHKGQLGELIKMKTGKEIKNKLLKFDGRNFYLDEVIKFIDEKII